MFNIFKILFFIFCTFNAKAWGNSLNSTDHVKNYLHIHTSDPKFSFEIPNFKNWRLEIKSETYIRFLPDDTIPVAFEEPPKILVFLENRFKDLKLSISKTAQVTKNKISYKTVDIEGFSLKGILFENENTKVIVTILDYNGHGLDKLQAEKLLKDTFKFIKK